MQDNRAVPFNKERFLNLIRATKEANPENFSMSNYGWSENEDATRTCGSPACVLGNFAARADLQDVFVLEPAYEGGYPMVRPVGPALQKRALSYNDTAILDYFGITYREVEELFSEDGCGAAGDSRDAAVAYLRAFYKRITGEDAPV